jgi:hypothetical protein
MRVVYLLLFLSLPVYGEDWIVRGKDYRNVIVGQIEADRVHIAYDGGIGSISLADLSPELQKKFKYDPAKAKIAVAQRKEAAKPDWEKISSKLLLPWVDEITEETNTARTSDEIQRAKVQQGRLRIFSAFLEQANLSNTSDPGVKKWIDCVMQNQICVGMPKTLVLLSWADPDSDTTSTTGDGDDWETLNYGHFSSLVFLSGGIVKNITQTQTSNN